MKEAGCQARQSPLHFPCFPSGFAWISLNFPWFSSSFPLVFLLFLEVFLSPSHNYPTTSSSSFHGIIPIIIITCVEEGPQPLPPVVQALDLGIARDQEGVVEDKLEQALREGADVLLTSGGVSMGDRHAHT